MLFEKNNTTLDSLLKNAEAKQKPAIIEWILDVVKWFKEKLSGNKDFSYELQRLETKYTALLKESQKVFEQQQTAQETKNSTEGGEEFSVRKDIVDVNGKEYENVVELDKIASKRVLSEPKRLFNYIKANFVGLKIPVEDNNGNTEIIEFATEDETVTKNGNNHLVLRELAHTKGETRRKVVINAKEVIEQSMYDPEYSSNDNEHGWLDKNGWESRKTYVLQDGVIYEAYLRIAKAKDGRNILYAVNLNINNGIAVDQGATQKRAAILSAMPSSYSISNTPANVNSNSIQENAENTETDLEAEDMQYSISPETDTESEGVEYSISPEEQEVDYTAKFDEVSQQFERGDITRADFVEQVKALYTQAGDTYGTIEKGEAVTGNENFKNPVPKTVDGTKNVRRYVRTVMEGGNLTEDMLTVEKQQVLSGDVSRAKPVLADHFNKRAAPNPTACRGAWVKIIYCSAAWVKSV